MQGAAQVENLVKKAKTYTIISAYMNIKRKNSGPDYMSRAGLVSRAGVSLPGSLHIKINFAII